MKKGLLLIFSILLLIPITKASHVVGGDIYIQWISANTYHFKLRAYRDDVNGVTMPASITIRIHDAVTKATIYTQTLNKTNAFTLVPLGDPCYTPDPNVVRIEEGIFESPVNMTIANNPNGYYVEAQISARNSLAINVQAGGTMTWFAMMPDPAIGQNSSPDFGNYPNDAYFCITGPKIFNYPITDGDGDSLVYSLTEPLGSAVLPTYPYYGGLTWNGGYSLANIIGGPTPMSINPVTGTITAQPALQGFFTFAIRVEEFRDTTTAQNGPKVKIGETRRDVQYISLNCTNGNPPQFLNTVPVMNQTLQIPYNKLYCKDLIFNDLNTGDTIFLQFVSPIFDSGAYLATVPPDINGDLHYFYNFNGVIWQDSVVIPPNQFDTTEQAYFNVGTVANRFCWTPGCDEIGKTFPFQVNAFSLGCDGKSQDSILFNLQVVPPVVNLAKPDDEEIPFGQEYCRNIVFSDTSLVDLIGIEVTSSIFSEGAEFPTVDNNFFYQSWVTNSVVTGVPNGANNTQTVAKRFCWTPDCEHIGTTHTIKAAIFSVDCEDAFSDTIEYNITVKPPFDSLDVIPNVITPNGDGVNDFYTFGYTNSNGDHIGGVSNPCHDEIKIQIFNRWGLLIYESLEYPEFQWNGTNKSGNDAPAGTYFVLVTGTYGNETVTLDQRSVTILR